MIGPIEIPDYEAMTEFFVTLAAVQERRAKGVPVAQPRPFDGARLANAFRAKPRPAAPAAPTRRALSAAPCPHCAVRGHIGCSHFLPYLGAKHDHE